MEAESLNFGFDFFEEDNAAAVSSAMPCSATFWSAAPVPQSASVPAGASADAVLPWKM